MTTETSKPVHKTEGCGHGLLIIALGVLTPVLALVALVIASSIFGGENSEVSDTEQATGMFVMALGVVLGMAIAATGLIVLLQGAWKPRDKPELPTTEEATTRRLAIAWVLTSVSAVSASFSIQVFPIAPIVAVVCGLAALRSFNRERRLDADGTSTRSPRSHGLGVALALIGSVIGLTALLVGLVIRVTYGGGVL